MCVIIYKPAGAQLPPEIELENGYHSNPDGCGLMVRKKDSVYFFKTLDFGEFMRKLDYLNRKYNLKDYDVGIHFRLATHGDKTAANAHPYPIPFNRRRKGHAKAAVMHNGIFSVDHDLAEEKGMSDTALWVKYILEPIILHSTNVPLSIELLSEEVKEKVLIFTKRRVYKLGYEWIEYEGRFYSNYSCLVPY